MTGKQLQGSILVVDDSRTVRTSIRKLLEKAGYDVIEVDNGKSAVEIYAEQNIDLITLDIEMPEIDGYETCRLIRNKETILVELGKRKFTVPVVFVTSNDSFEGRKKGFEAGGCKFLTKNRIKTDLVDEIDQILRPSKILEGVKILVADDSRMIHLMIERVLQPLGAELVFCSDGLSSYNLLKSEGRTFDLVILDNQMPELNGIEVCKSIRQELNLLYTPVLFLSGTQSRDDQMEFFKSGASDYVLKPFIREELLARIKNQVHSYSWLKHENNL